MNVSRMEWPEVWNGNQQAFSLSIMPNGQKKLA